jgi:integrase
LFESFKATKIKVESSSIEEHILNPATINNIAYSIKSFFKYLIDYYNYPKNPLSSYKPLKTKQHSSTQSLNRGELLDILKQAKLDYLDILVKSNKPKKHLTKLRDYLIFSLLALSLRRDEICKIRWDDFKESSYLHISQK